MKLYHGTSSQWLPKIRNEGIKPRGRSKSNWTNTVESNPRSVYLTNSYPLYFAENAVNDKHLLAVIEVDVDTLDPFLLAPDEDFLEQATRSGGSPEAISGKDMKQRTRWFRKKALLEYQHLWNESLNHLGTCGYYGCIPPECITRYAVIEKRAPIRGMSDPTITLINYKIMGGYYRNLVHHIFGDPLVEDMIPELGTKLTDAPRDGILIVDMEAVKNECK